MKLRRRMKLYGRQNGKCPYCFLKMDPHPAQGRGDNGFTKDHVTPRSKGGKQAGNLILVHWGCNHAKGDRSPTQAELHALAWAMGKGKLRPAVSAG